MRTTMCILVTFVCVSMTNLVLDFWILNRSVLRWWSNGVACSFVSLICGNYENLIFWIVWLIRLLCDWMLLGINSIIVCDWWLFCGIRLRLRFVSRIFRSVYFRLRLRLCAIFHRNFHRLFYWLYRCFILL